jgi:signal recognition particle subunit SRP54
MSLLYTHLINGFQTVSDSFAQLNAADTLSLEQVEQASKQLKTLLLEADVALPVVKRFLVEVKERSLGQARLDGVSPSEQFIGILFDVLKDALGQEHTPLVLESVRAERPPMVMMVGLQGAGKTTSIAKLALYLKEVHGRIPFLIAADTTRPAAMEQLALLAHKAEIPCYVDTSATEMRQVVQAGLASAQAQSADVVLVDTAGRVHADSSTMADLLLLERQLQPENVLLVLDGMIGQQALGVAQTFSTQIGITGVVLTKMDAEARGGAMLSVKYQTGLPIQFLGVSEHLDGLEPFHPERMAQRLLNMGDVLTLFEKAQRASLDKQSQRLHERMMQGLFDCKDYLQLMGGLSKLGGLGGILSMLPLPFLTNEGKQSLSKQQGDTLRQGKVIVSSMTQKEITSPSLVLETPSRVQRISKGCGLSDEAVTGFLTQVVQLQSMLSLFSGFGNLFGGAEDASSTEATSANKTAEITTNNADDDDPLGWGSFFSSMGMDEFATPSTSSASSQSRTKNNRGGAANKNKKPKKPSLLDTLFSK